MAMRHRYTRGCAALAVLAAAAMAALGGGPAGAVRWGEDYFPNVPVVTHDGKTVRFYDDLVRGRIVVVNFIYVTCPDLCSLSTARMARLRDMLGDAVGRDVFIYSVTIDPENDTPEVMRQYADAFDAGDGWLFLTGKPDDIHLLRWKLGERARTLSEHRSDMVLGNDATGEWRRISVMGNLKIVAQTVLEMDPEVRERVRPVSTDSLKRTRDDYRIENRPGEALYLKACSFCHTIGNGDRFGPDLKGVTARRDRDWLVRMLMDPDLMRKEKDPIALDLAARYPGVTMPYLGLSEADAEDVISYISTETERLGDLADSAGPEPGHDHHDHTHDHHKQSPLSESGMEETR